MENIRIKAILSTNSVTNKWEEPSCSNLPELINSIKNFKQSVNNYLTDLVNKEKDKFQKDAENSDDNEEGGEEDTKDIISGFIKEAVAHEEMKISKKRKVYAGAKFQEAKRKK